MRKLAMMTVCLVLLPYRIMLGQGQDSSRVSRNAAPSTQAVDSQAVRFMPMMWMHLDSMGRWSPAQMQQMMVTHQRMAGQMMQMMGPGHMMGRGMGMAPGSPWTALRDSIQADLSVMPRLSGRDLAARRSAHIDRMRRMMVLGMGMMGGGGWATMPGGCGMLDSVGRMSASQAQWMWTMHSQMSGQMINAMMANMRGRGVTPSPRWLALRDSAQADMAELPKLTGDSLRSRMQVHADRMHRLMGMQVEAMGMPVGPMGMSCQW
jgi:hypothetical protein